MNHNIVLNTHNEEDVRIFLFGKQCSSVTNVTQKKSNKDAIITSNSGSNNFFKGKQEKCLCVNSVTQKNSKKDAVFECKNGSKNFVEGKKN